MNIKKQPCHPPLPQPESVDQSIAKLLDPNKKNFLGIIGIQGDGKSTLMQEISKQHPDIFPWDQLFEPDDVYSLFKRFDQFKSFKRKGNPAAKRGVVTLFYAHGKRDRSFAAALLPHHDIDGYLDFLRKEGFDNIGLIYVMAGALEDNMRRVNERRGEKMTDGLLTWIRTMDIKAKLKFPRLIKSKELHFSLVIDNSEDHSEMRVLLEYDRGKLVRRMDPLPDWCRKRLPTFQKRIRYSVQDALHGVPDNPHIRDVIESVVQNQKNHLGRG